MGALWVPSRDAGSAGCFALSGFGMVFLQRWKVEMKETKIAYGKSYLKILFPPLSINHDLLSEQKTAFCFPLEKNEL